jgi:hypothetical protein
MNTINIDSGGEMKKISDNVKKKELKKIFEKYKKNNFICFSVDINQKYNENLKQWKKDIKWSKWKDLILQDVKINDKYNGIALKTGKENNIIVIDIDNLDSWNKLLEDNDREEPNTLKVISGNGGKHLYFNYDDELSILKSNTDIFGENYKGIDIRTNGGCIIAPPTTYHNNNLNKFVSYEWENKKDICKYEMENIPKWLKKLLLQNNTQEKNIKKENEEANEKNIKKVNKEENQNLFLLDTEEKKNICREILNELKISTCDNHNSWLSIVMALYNITNGCPILAREWSKKSDKYDDNEFNKRFYSFKKGNANYNIGTLLYYLKQDTEPQKYIELKNKMYVETIKDKIKNITLLDIFNDGYQYECQKVNTKYLIERNHNKEIELVNNPNTDQKIVNNIIYNWIKSNKHSLILSSAYNTGKTTLINRLLSHFNKILFISCRVALSNDIYGNFKNFGFKHYKKTKDLLCDRLIVQYESLQKIINEGEIMGYDEINNYDLIIVDESESILHYADAKHQKENINNFDNLVKFIKKSNKTLYLDGDITNRTLNFANTTSNNNLIYVKNEFSHNKSIKILENVIEYNKELYNDIENKNKILLCSMSEIKARNYKEKLSEKYPSLKILLLTGKTDSKTKLENTENVNETWINYDVVIITSAVDIGVSFDIDEHFYKVYGILSSGCGTPRSFLQMTARARKVKNNEITILNDVGVFKYNENIYIPFWTYQEVKENIKLILRNAKTDENGKYIYNEENLYMQNYIFNKMEYLNSTPYYFIPYLKLLCKEKKWDLNHIECENKKDKKQHYAKYNIDEIYKGEIISPDKFNDLCEKEKKEVITEKERNNKDKFNFEIYKLNLTFEQYNEYNEQRVIYNDDNKIYECYDKNNKKIKEWTKKEIDDEKKRLKEEQIKNINKDNVEFKYQEPTFLNNKALWIRLMYEKYFNSNTYNNFLNVFDKENNKKDINQHFDNYLDDIKIDSFNKLLEVLNVNKKALLNGVVIDGLSDKILSNIKDIKILQDKFINEKKIELDKILSKKEKGDQENKIIQTLQDLFNKYGFNLFSKLIKINRDNKRVSTHIHMLAPNKDIMDMLINGLRFNSANRVIKDTKGIFLPFKTEIPKKDIDVFEAFDIKQE